MAGVVFPAYIDMIRIVMYNFVWVYSTLDYYLSDRMKLLFIVDN